MAVAIPLSAGAVPFTFQNGTVADATQVNANFAAFTPVTGYTQASVAGAVNGTVNLLAPSFTPTRATTCVVTVETAPPLQFGVSVFASGSASASGPSSTLYRCE